MKTNKLVFLLINILEATPENLKAKQEVSNVTIDEIPHEEEMNPYKRLLPKPVKDVQTPRVNIEKKLFKINSPSERNHKLDKSIDENLNKSSLSKATL